jgi:RecA-family ATPase
MQPDPFEAIQPLPPLEAYQDQRPAPPFQFVPVADLKYRAPEYIIMELFEADTLGLIFGDPGCGKSFLAVDIALSVATGTPFHGRDTKQGSVFFIAGEGHNGLARRFAAWSQARGVSLAGVPLFKSERAAQFLDGATRAADRPQGRVFLRSATESAVRFLIWQPMKQNEIMITAR